MDSKLLKREAELEAESIELEERLRRAKESNLPESIIKYIEKKIAINNQSFNCLMNVIYSELEGRYY